jgi:RNA polymerase sigma-54 factor
MSGMGFNLSQGARLGQNLRLSPRMLTTMSVLQLPLGELEERVEQELQENIALERAEPDGSSMDPGDARTDGQDASDGADDRALVVEDGGAADFDRLDRFERRYGEELDSDSWRESRRLDGEPDARSEAMANTPARTASLEEQLLEQWMLVDASPRMSAIGRVLAGFVGDDGLLHTPIGSIAAAAASIVDPPATEAEVSEASRLFQHLLEPPGMGAADVRESLLSQLDVRRGRSGDDDRAWHDARLLIEHHLDDLEANRIPRIQERTGMTTAQLDAARAMLQHLDPSPASGLTSRPVPGIRPDVIVTHDAATDRWSARLADGSEPSVRLAEEYVRMSRDPKVDKSTRDLIKSNMQRGRWFIEALGQRGATLLRVVDRVLDRQRDWFEFGPGHLKPLPMLEVAADIGMNVSTVSRAVAGKWLQTPRGIVELRRFFTGGTHTEQGAVSWDAVKERLREVVAAEDRAKPLSDEAIAKALKVEGITLARRTVVKYREQLGIPPARLRRAHPGT